MCAIPENNWLITGRRAVNDDDLAVNHGVPALSRTQYALAADGVVNTAGITPIALPTRCGPGKSMQRQYILSC